MAEYPSDAKARIAAILQRLEHEARIVSAATLIASDGGYCDFFVENNDGGPFHEKCPNDPFLGLELTTTKFSSRRMDGLAALRPSAKDDYPDFFVEGSGPPWHERIDDFGVRERLVNPAQRAFALRRSDVLHTFTRIAENAARR